MLVLVIIRQYTLAPIGLHVYPCVLALQLLNVSNFRAVPLPQACVAVSQVGLYDFALRIPVFLLLIFDPTCVEIVATGLS